jgi:hypothetical protein
VQTASTRLCLKSYDASFECHFVFIIKAGGYFQVFSSMHIHFVPLPSARYKQPKGKTANNRQCKHYVIYRYFCFQLRKALTRTSNVSFMPHHTSSCRVGPLLQFPDDSAAYNVVLHTAGGVLHATSLAPVPVTSAGRASAADAASM